MSFYDSNTYIHDLETTIKSVIHAEKLYHSRVLVTGATGTIGSFIVDTLLQLNKTENADIVIYALGRSSARLQARFGDIHADNLIFVQHDMNNAISFDFDIDYIIHAAGNAYPAAFNHDQVGTIVGNIFGTYSLLKYAETHAAKRLLYVSTGEVYGQGNLNMDELSEEYSGYLDTTSPRSCYPISKRAAENLCCSYSRQYGLETVIVRPCHTYGPCMTENDNRANVQFLRNALNGENIVLKSAGTQMRSYCYIADCVSVILSVLINGKSGEAYNSANPDSRITIAGFAQKVADISGGKVIFVDPTAKEAADRTPIERQVLSAKKVMDLGWKGCYTIEQGIANTLKILKESY